MTGFMFAAHLWASGCAMAIGTVLFTAMRSPEYRFKIGPSEADRSFNFGVVSLFMYALGLDLLAAPFGIEDFTHKAAVSLACLTGTIAVGKFAWRGWRWRT